MIYFFPTRTDVLDFSQVPGGAPPGREPVPGQADDRHRHGGAQADRGRPPLLPRHAVHGGDEVACRRTWWSSTSWTRRPRRPGHGPGTARPLGLQAGDRTLATRRFPATGSTSSTRSRDQRHWTLKCPACGHWTGLEREFPAKLGQEVHDHPAPGGRDLLPGLPEVRRGAGPGPGRVGGGLPGPAHPRLPDLPAVLQPRWTPGRSLEEYRTTRFPDRFYNLKIGIPWADLERRLDVGAVLACCGTTRPRTTTDSRLCSWAWTPGRSSTWSSCSRHSRSGQVAGTWSTWRSARVRGPGRPHGAVSRSGRCVIDGLPETHATREFAQRAPGAGVHELLQRAPAGRPRVGPEEPQGRGEPDRSPGPLAAAHPGAEDDPRPGRSSDLQEFAQHMWLRRQDDRGGRGHGAAEVPVHPHREPTTSRWPSPTPAWRLRGAAGTSVCA